MRLRKKYGAMGPSWIGTQRRVAPRDVLIFGGGTWPPHDAVAMQKAHEKGGTGYFGPLVSF